MTNFLRNKRIYTSPQFDLQSDGGGVSLVTSDDKVKSLLAGTNVTVVDNLDGTVTISSTGGGASLTVVTDYNDLPLPNTVSGDFYWVSNSIGTSWLPWSLGGTYYPNGVYYSNGVTWEYIETPYNATQLEVNAGTNTDKFVTPETLKNSTQFQYLDATSSIQTQINNLTTALPNDLSAWRKTGTGTFKRYYGCSITGLALSTQTIARNNIQYMPVVISRTCTMNEVGLEITVAGTAGSVLRIGLYNSSDLLPTSLVFDAGTILGDSATKQFITLGTPQVLQPNLYFFAINHNSVANITVRAIALGACMPLLGQSVTAGTAVGTFYVNTSSAYAAFASTAVTPTTIGTIAMPEVQFYLSA